MTCLPPRINEYERSSTTAANARASALVGRAIGHADFPSFDMGGTTARDFSRIPELVTRNPLQN